VLGGSPRARKGAPRTAGALPQGQGEGCHAVFLSLGPSTSGPSNSVTPRHNTGAGPHFNPGCADGGPAVAPALCALWWALGCAALCCGGPDERRPGLFGCVRARRCDHRHPLRHQDQPKGACHGQRSTFKLLPCPLAPGSSITGGGLQGLRVQKGSTGMLCVLCKKKKKQKKTKQNKTKKMNVFFGLFFFFFFGCRCG